MCDFLKNEYKKVNSYNILIKYSIIFIICIILCLFLIEIIDIEQDASIAYIYYYLNIYMPIIYPFIASIYYCIVIGIEYKERTISLFATSVYERYKLYLKKYLFSFISFSIMFIIFNILLIAIIIFKYGSPNLITNYENIPLSNIYFRLFFVLVLESIFLAALGSLAQLITIITRNRNLSIIIIISLFIIKIFIRLPESFSMYEKYNLFGSKYVFTILTVSKGSFIYNTIDKFFIFLIYILIINGFGMYIFNNQEIY